MPKEALSAQPAREQNVDAIAAYFESGVKDEARLLGIELEHTLVHEDGSPVSFAGEHGVERLLETLSADFPERTYDEEGNLIGVAAPGRAVTIEPACQVELSAGPFGRIADAAACFEAFERRLRDIMEPAGVRVLERGYHPTARAAELELIPKKRYRYMDAHFARISDYGRCMMRGSASTQVSIDYTSVGDCLRKLRLAFALAPLFSLVCDNAPVFEGELRERNMARAEIWRFCDPERSETVPGAMDADFDLRRYAEHILDMPAILVRGADGETRADGRTFGEIYADTPMTRADVEHALSMSFTDARLKTYIEIRPADAMPISHAMAYAALVKGLFYRKASLDTLDALFADVREADIDAAKTSLMEDGYRGRAYGRPAAELIDELMTLAAAALDEEDAPYLEPLLTLTARRTTLSDSAKAAGRRFD